MAKENVTATQLFTALRPVFGRDIYCGNVLFDNQTEQLKLSSLQGQQYDVWGLVNIPFFINGRSYKLADFATVQKGQSPQKVAKKTNNIVFACNMNISVHPNKEKTVEEGLGGI